MHFIGMHNAIVLLFVFFTYYHRQECPVPGLRHRQAAKSAHVCPRPRMPLNGIGYVQPRTDIKSYQVYGWSPSPLSPPFVSRVLGFSLRFSLSVLSPRR